MLRNKKVLKVTLLSTLIVSCLIILSACSPKVVTVVKEVPVLTPESLLVDPCEPVGAGDTVRSLARAYVTNTSCLGEYRLLIEKQRKHKKLTEKVYGVP